MELLYLVVGIVVSIAVVILGYLLHCGLLYTPVIRTGRPESMPRRAAYVLKQGPYKNCGPEFAKLHKLARGAKLFGLYYDDTEKVAPDKLRYIVSCCLPDEEGSELEKNLVLKGYKVFQFPVCEKAVITEFPTKNNILSMILSMWIVYPKFKRYLKEHNLYHRAGPCLEVYEKGLTWFYAPMEENEKYCVPGVTFTADCHDKKDD